ncbi:MAG: DUF4388 domain-containing protein [Chloroflexi bacterium]|uniref:DUF4388 domain-containing protein n=1 Tax=Candidatus Chlorohelix allophototropha TaxID=3003348 RepID=A0A8T7M1R4_9CHLR|nr:DUF4388 domain-containing protein [Chloroflexota bacterium]WJW66612.1 DUF4388 domain-containing protein [Chloroflexota bacterium L227-S17]
MALVGNLKDFGLAEFLYLVDRGYKTGRLTLQRPGDRAELYFQTGKLVYASHFGQEERLGDMLVRMGRITQEQVNYALRIQHTREPNKPLGAILVSNNIISTDEINKCVRLQIEEITYGLFNWNEGDFKFEQDVQPPPESLTIPLSVENIIMEGTRRIDEWTRIRDRIPNLDVVVRFSDQPHEKAKGVNLTPDEWRVFARINGLHSIRQIAQLTHLSEFDVARILYGFLSAGLVIISKQPPQAALNGGYPRTGLASPNAPRPVTAPAPAPAKSAQAVPPPVQQRAQVPVNGQYNPGYAVGVNAAPGPGLSAQSPPLPPQTFKKSLIRRIIDAISRR